MENFREYAGKKEGWSLEMPNYEGVRVNAGQKSWFLIRLSLHEPNIETEKEGMGNDILEELKDYFKKYEKMEI